MKSANPLPPRHGRSKHIFTMYLEGPVAAPEARRKGIAQRLDVGPTGRLHGEEGYLVWRRRWSRSDDPCLRPRRACSTSTERRRSAPGAGMGSTRQLSAKPTMRLCVSFLLTSCSDDLAPTARQIPPRVAARHAGGSNSTYAHVPMVVAPDGDRLAKRVGLRRQRDFRERGNRTRRGDGTRHVARSVPRRPRAMSPRWYKVAAALPFKGARIGQLLPHAGELPEREVHADADAREPREHLAAGFTVRCAFRPLIAPITSLR